MWFIQPKKSYISQMPWKHANEPAIMTWQIRTRDYYALLANVLFCINLIIAAGVGWVMYHAGGDSLIASLLSGGGMFFFLLLIGISMTHQTAIIVYRLTDKRLEVFSWKPQIDSVKPVMKWTAIVSGLVVLFFGVC